MQKVLTNLIKRKTLFAFVLALTIFGAVYGFAATLSVGANQLSAGNATVAACQTGQAVGTYGIAYDPTLGGYKVSTVTVTGLDSANCGGKAISVTLTGLSNTNLATLTGLVPTTGSTLPLTPSGTIDAQSVTGVSIAING